LHQTIREYLEAETPAALRPVVAERHARWVAVLASQLAAGPGPGGDLAWIRRHAVERDDFQAAALWLLATDPAAALQLLIHVEPGVDQSGETGWHDDLMRRAVSRLGGSAPAAEASAWALFAWADSDEGRPEALDELARAVELLEGTDDPVAACYVLSGVAKCHADASGELDAEEAAAAVAAADRIVGTHWPILARELLSYKAPEPLGSMLLTEARAYAEQLGLPYFAARMGGHLACVACFRGDADVALGLWRAIAESPQASTLLDGENGCFYALAEAEHRDVAAGLRLAAELIVRPTSGPAAAVTAPALHRVTAHLWRLAGDLDAADLALREAERYGPPTRNFAGGLAIVTRSAIERMRGEPADAAREIASAAWHLGFRGSTDIPMRVMEEGAAVAVDLGVVAAARDLVATASAARVAQGKPASPASRRDVRRVVAAVGVEPARALTADEAAEVIHRLVP
jgi:hypothetical protein